MKNLLSSRVVEKKMGSSKLQEGWRVPNSLSMVLTLGKKVFDKSRINWTGDGLWEIGEVVIADQRQFGPRKSGFEH
jgi:hypothetical protein